MDELALDHCFWNALSTWQTFLAWLISKTKFLGRPLSLVRDEKWHQRWYRNPETKEESETDILVLLEDTETSERLALHIENKPPHGQWRRNQPENYQIRAENRMGPLRYTSYQTVLLAPSKFIVKHRPEAAHFELWLSYEDVSMYVPEFKL